MGDAPLVVYLFPGSQFSAKVLVALDAYKIDYFCHYVSLQPSSRKLPSGGTLVPELQIFHEDKPAEAIPDSEAILTWISEHYRTELYPNKEAKELSKRCCDGIISGAVLYYNWVDYDGYSRSMKRNLDENLPSYVMLFRSQILDFMVSSTREKFKKKVMESMKVNEQEVEDTAKIERLLLDELIYFQNLLKSDSQKYLLPGSKIPSVVDCSLYSMMERFVGDMGDANVHASFPNLIVNHPELERLNKWYLHMRKSFPLKFKGRRVPPDLLEKMKVSWD